MLHPEVLEQKVVGDDERIIQVLRHFLSNAIKFTPDGGKTLSLLYCFVHGSFLVYIMISANANLFPLGNTTVRISWLKSQDKHDTTAIQCGQRQ